MRYQVNQNRACLDALLREENRGIINMKRKSTIDWTQASKIKCSPHVQGVCAHQVNFTCLIAYHFFLHIQQKKICALQGEHLAVSAPSLHEISFQDITVVSPSGSAYNRTWQVLKRYINMRPTVQMQWPTQTRDSRSKGRQRGQAAQQVPLQGGTNSPTLAHEKERPTRL